MTAPRNETHQPDGRDLPGTQEGRRLNWFERLTGFPEGEYEETRQRLEVVGTRLRSKVNAAQYEIGRLETPSLLELRQHAGVAAETLAGPLKVTHVSGDARLLHAQPANANAMFQVASQFNLLEMVDSSVTPEDGVTRYAFDFTQGPACALAAGAATIYRNYFAPVAGEAGQTNLRQLDCLGDLGAALGNAGGFLWEMRNGYALCTPAGLASLDERLRALDAGAMDQLRGLLRIGVQWGVQVTDSVDPGHRVSQAFCSALPVAYTRIARHHWTRFATLILESAYEATLCSAAVNAARHGSNVVFLTRVGGGAFGNDDGWIDQAMRRAFDLFKNVALDVRIVNRGPRVHDRAYA